VSALVDEACPESAWKRAEADDYQRERHQFMLRFEKPPPGVSDIEARGVGNLLWVRVPVADEVQPPSEADVDVFLFAGAVRCE